MEWFSAAFPGSPSKETVEGIDFIRDGRQWTVHWRAYKRYRRLLKQSFDVVVDQINTIPFFTPLWSTIPHVAFIHQLAREVWWYESVFPLNAIGFAAEPLYLWPYHRSPFITVSHSTASDLMRLGWSGRVGVIHEGCEPVSVVGQVAQSEPVFLYVGRLTPSKRVGDLVRAIAAFRRLAGCGVLRLIGAGNDRYVASLASLADRLGVGDFVAFLGSVDEVRKHEEMATAYALLMASVREGWGLVVTEANSFGTPAIAYDVPGLRDSVRDQATGILVEQTPEAMASAMVQLWRDRPRRRSLGSAARDWAASMTFADMAMQFRGELTAACSLPVVEVRDTQNRAQRDPTKRW